MIPKRITRSHPPHASHTAVPTAEFRKFSEINVPCFPSLLPKSNPGTYLALFSSKKMADIWLLWKSLCFMGFPDSHFFCHNFPPFVIICQNGSKLKALCRVPKLAAPVLPRTRKLPRVPTVTSVPLPQNAGPSGLQPCTSTRSFHHWANGFFLRFRWPFLATHLIKWHPSPKRKQTPQNFDHFLAVLKNHNQYFSTPWAIFFSFLNGQPTPPQTPPK